MERKLLIFFALDISMPQNDDTRIITLIGYQQKDSSSFDFEEAVTLNTVVSTDDPRELLDHLSKIAEILNHAKKKYHPIRLQRDYSCNDWSVLMKDYFDRYHIQCEMESIPICDAYSFAWGKALIGHPEDFETVYERNYENRFFKQENGSPQELSLGRARSLCQMIVALWKADSF